MNPQRPLLNLSNLYKPIISLVPCFLSLNQSTFTAGSSLRSVTPLVYHLIYLLFPNPLTMSHTPFDRHPTYFPLEDGESLSYENHVPPRNPSYPQATPRSVYRYVEPSHPPPSPLFGAGIQNQGAMNQYVGHVPEPSTRFHNELIPDWAPNDAPPVAPEIMVYGTWNNVQVADMNGFYPGYPSPSAGRVSQEPTFTRAPTEGFTPRSSRHGPSDK